MVTSVVLGQRGVMSSKSRSGAREGDTGGRVRDGAEWVLTPVRESL